MKRKVGALRRPRTESRDAALNGFKAAAQVGPAAAAAAQLGNSGTSPMNTDPSRSRRE